MPNLRCKMCGGIIQSIAPRIGECEDCGTRVLLPLVDQDRIITLYNRGNHFREIGEYDRAYAAYESVAAENRDDAEAHWCLMLCRYGINYVKDARSGEFRPTISRMNRAPILEDPDYLAALRCSEGDMQQQYRREGRRLASIQNRFLEIMKAEKPYDVFICFKAEESNGERTKASELGQTVYEELTARGLRIFFSRVTLEDKLGEEYEPYIFSALYTAKVMLVVADKAEQLTARWVKNEWIRFLAMMDQDNTKAMIPVFYRMNPYDFPPEIPMVQGQDMEKLGAMQDLTKNVLSLCGKTPDKVRLISQPSSAPMNVDNMVRRIRIWIDDGNFEEAGKRLKEVAEEAAENGEAWYCRLLYNNRASNMQELMKKGCDWTETEEFRLAWQYGDDALKKELDALQKACLIEHQYREGKAWYEQQKYAKALEVLGELGDYKDAAAVAEKCRQILEQARNMERYRAEIGDGKTYLTRQVKAGHAKEYAKYQRLKQTQQNRKGSTLFDAGWLAVVLVAIAWAVAFWLWSTQGLSGLATGCMWLFMGALSLMIGCAADSLLWGIGAMVVLCIVADHIPFSVIRVGAPALLAVISLVCLAVGCKNIRCKAAKSALEAYRKEIIAPLEKQLQEEVSRQWEPLIGKENLVPLSPVE